MSGKAEWKMEGKTQNKSLHLLQVWSSLQKLPLRHLPASALQIVVSPHNNAFTNQKEKYHLEQIYLKQPSCLPMHSKRKFKNICLFIPV